MTVKGKISLWESQRAKEKSLLYRLLIRTFTQGFYDRLLSRGRCDNMPKKGNHRRITSKTPYDKVKRLQKKENTRERKSGEFRKRFSAKLRFALVFRSAFQFVLRRVLVCGARARSAKVCGAATAAPQCLKAALVIDKHTPRCHVLKKRMILTKHNDLLFVLKYILLIFIP